MYLCYRFYYNQWEAKIKRIYEQLSSRERHYELKETFCLIQQGNDLAYFLTDSNAVHDEFLLYMETEKLAPETIPLTAIGTALYTTQGSLIYQGSDYIYAQVKG